MLVNLSQVAAVGWDCLHFAGDLKIKHCSKWNSKLWSNQSNVFVLSHPYLDTNWKQTTTTTTTTCYKSFGNFANSVFIQFVDDFPCILFFLWCIISQDSCDIYWNVIFGLSHLIWGFVYKLGEFLYCFLICCTTEDTSSGVHHMR